MIIAYGFVRPLADRLKFLYIYICFFWFKILISIKCSLMEPRSVGLTVVVVCSVLVVVVISMDPSFEVDHQALKAFKSSVADDPSGVLADWSEANHHCNWSGITCDPSSSRVMSIILMEKQLAGVISPFLGNLSKLQVLDERNQNCSGKAY